MADIFTGNELRAFCEAHGIKSPALSAALGVSLASASNILAGRQWKASIPVARLDAVSGLASRYNGVHVLAESLPAADPAPVPAVDPAPVPAVDPAPAAQEPPQELPAPDPAPATPAFDWSAWAEQQAAPAQPQPQPQPQPEPQPEPGPCYRVSFIEHAQTNQLTPAELTWPELTALFLPANVTPGPKDGRGILFGHFTGNVRQKPNFQELDAFVIDGDSTVDKDTGEVVKGCIPPQQAHDILKAAGVPHLLFTTHSHDPARDYHRWRAVVFPSRPITTEEELVASVRSVWRVLWQQAPVYLSEESLKTAQLWYLPRVDPSRPDTYAVFADTNAPLWDVDAALVAHRAEAEAAARALQADPDAAPSVDIVRGLDRGDDLFGFYSEALGLEGLRDLLTARGYELHSTGRDTYRLLSPHSGSGSPGVVVYRHHKTGCPLVTSHHDSDPDLEIGAAYTAAGALARLYFGGDFGRVRRWLDRLRADLANEQRLAEMRRDLGDNADAVEEFAKLSEVAQAGGWKALKKQTDINMEFLRPIVAELSELLEREPLTCRDGLLPELEGELAADYERVAPLRQMAMDVFADIPDPDDDVDAPIQAGEPARWPDDFMVSERGTFFIPPAEEGEPMPRPIKLAGFIDVIGEARDTRAGEDWSLVVGFTDRDGVEHRSLIPRAALYGDTSAFATLLAGAGLWVSNGKGHVLLLMGGLNRVRVGSRLALVRSTGWHEFRDEGGRAFVLPDWVVGTPPEGEGVFWSPAKGTYSNHKFASAGTLKQWQEEVSALAVGNRIVMFCIAAAFAAPLLRLLKMGSIIYHLLGISTKGKTTAMIVGGSVVGGDPDAKLGFGHSWNMTDVGVEENAAAHSDVLMMLDELKQAPAHAVEGIVYALSSGAGRARGQGAGGLRATKKWTTLALSSGEKTLDEVLADAGRKRADAGTQVRMINIPAVHHAHGSFEELHGFPDGKTFSEHLERVAKTEQFGTAFREYMTKLVGWLNSKPQECLKTIKEQCDAWRAKYVPAQAGSQIGRVASAMAVVAVAGEMATRWGITGWEEEAAAEAVGLVLKDVIAERGTFGDLEQHRSLLDLRAMIDRYYRTRFEHIDINYMRIEDTASEHTAFSSVGADGEPNTASVRTGRVNQERLGWVRRTHDATKGDDADTHEIMIHGDIWRELTGDKSGRGMPVAHAAKERGWLVTEPSKGREHRLTCRRTHPDTKGRGEFYVLNPIVMFADELDTDSPASADSDN